MGTLKKYSKERQEWYPVASDQASNITTSFYDGEGHQESVNEVLVQNRQEIDLLKKNVSWLALHGGGGSGYGGGTNVPNFEVYFTDVYGNKFNDNTMILSQNQQQLTLNYTIECSKSLMFTVQLIRDGKLIQTYKNIKADGYTKTVSISNVNKKTSLKVIAIYGINTADETRNSNTDNYLDINISAISIENGLYQTVTKEQLLNNTSKLVIRYNTSLGGDYTLYWSRSPFTTSDTESLSTRVQIMGVPSGQNIYNFDISNLSELNSNTQTGTYPYYFMLVREESGTTGKLYSQIQVCNINVIETNSLLITLLSDSSIDSSINQSNLCRFIVFSGLDQFSSYQYTLSYAPGEGPYPEDYNGFTTFFGNDPNNSNLYAFKKEQQYELVPSNIGISSVSENVDKYTIRIKAFVGSFSAYKDFILNVSQSDTNYLRKYEEYISDNTIFKYEFWDIASSGSDTVFTQTNQIRRNQTINVNSRIQIYNKGIDSSLSESGYIFRHLAHAEITVPNNTIFPKNSTDTSSLILPQSSFSIELSYRIGREISDDVTIFRLGNYNPVNKTGKGIVIKAHEYYINFGGESNLRGVLEDNTFNQLNIVVLPTKNTNDANSRDIQLYLNGKAFAIARGISYTNFIFPSNPQMCLAYDGDEQTLVSTYANVKIYSVKMYARALNVGQIVCSYINNYINDQRVGGQINSSLLNTLLENNSINPDKLVEESGAPICSIYDMEGSRYIIKEYLDQHGYKTPTGEKASLPTSLLDLPIPKVVLHTTDPNWTFGNFKRQGATIEADTNCTIEYYKEGEKETIFFGDNLASVTVGIQGTTTAGYNIKNVDIKFNNEILFSPKEDWYPENYFVLKADVVDSGHINNAVIGKFINTCYNDVNSLIDTSAFPVKRLIENSQYEVPSTFTTKACIEGFPVLLIIDFSSDTGGQNRDYQIMGIYSFNLGRNSVYNQGFEVLKRLRDPNNGTVISSIGSISFPSFFAKPEQEDLDNTFKAYCYEGEAVINNQLYQVGINETNYVQADIKVSDSEKYTFKNVEKNNSGQITVNGTLFHDKNGNTVAYNGHVQKYGMKYCGYFWSDHDSYWLNLFKEVYTGGDSSNVAVSSFAELCTQIARNVPYEDNAGISVTAQTGNIPRYRVTKNPDSDTYNLEQLSESVPISLPQTQESPSFSVRNVAFYYTVAMLFGLIDNLGKNMQFKQWIEKSTNQKYPWSPTFYDMDTALKLDNSGIETYPPDVFDCTFVNQPNNQISSVYGTGLQCDYSDKTYRVHSNKLFGIDNDVFLDKWSSEYTKSSEGGKNMYSQMWEQIRTRYIPDVDKFVNDYFELQLHQCGELIFNLDYEMKYVDTTQYNMLHGDRLGTIRNWLKERVVFLDSVFKYKANKNTDRYKETYLRDIKYDVPVNDKIHVTFENGNNPLVTTFNTSCIVTSTYDNNYDYIAYAEKKKATPIMISLSGVGGQLYIDNSSCIVDMENLNEIGLKEISATATHDNVYYNELYSNGRLLGSLSSLQNFDIRNAQGISNEGINFGELFATWNTRYVDGTDPDSFGLRDINLSGVKSGLGNLNVNLNINNSEYSGIKVFENITNIDVSNSDVSAVSIPSGVSLNTLVIKGSVISELDLDGQPLLKTIDFTGCTALQTVRISNCSALQTLEFKTDNSNLRSIQIAGCDSLTSIIVNGDKEFSQNPTITIERCPNLQTVKILNCCSPIGSSPNLTINECYKVKTIDLSGSFIDTLYLDKGTNNVGAEEKITSLTQLNLSNSKVRVLRQVGDNNDDSIDLTGITSISTLTLQGNDYVQYVKVNNIQDSPFIIQTSGCFSKCSNLERVYGNLRINASSCFKGSKKFSVLGDITSYNGINIVSGGKYLHFVDAPGTITTDSNERQRPAFQQGSNVTNIELNGSNCSSSFNETSCTVLDVYYILYNISSNVTDISSLFLDCRKIGNEDVKGWTTEERSPSRHLFDNCKNIKNINSIFYGCGVGHIILYSPTYQNGDYQDDGLFSTLINCTTAATMFGTSANFNLTVDKNLFRLSSGKKFKLTDLSSTLAVSTISEDVNSINSQPNGDLTDFFVDLPDLQYIDLCFGATNYINYSTINLKNTKIVNFYLVFNCANGTGNIVFDNIFNKDLKILSSSFRITNGSNSRPRLEITNNIFDGFNQVECIGYVSTSRYSTVLQSIKNSSFEGVNKIITGNTFPYDLLNPMKNTIRLFTGFFNNAQFENASTTTQLPGTLFNECINLTDVHETFYDFQNKYSLTSDGFRDCKNLKNVSKLFASDVDTGVESKKVGRNKLTGFIPNNLFHVQGNEKTIEYQGILWNSSDSTHNLEVDSITNNKTVATITNGSTKITYRNFDYIDSTHIKRRPDTRISTTTTSSTYDPENEMYNQIDTTVDTYYGDQIGLDQQLSIVTINYEEPVKTINDMSYCFQGASIDTYQNNTIDINDRISLDTYQPYDYIRDNGNWRKVTKNTTRYSLMDIFDGVNYPDNATTLNGYEVLDEERSALGGTKYIRHFSDKIECGTYNSNYCCSPDLFKWCTSSCNITGLFRYCGVIKIGTSNTFASSDYMGSLTLTEKKEFGLKGRIPPYLFRYIPQTPNLNEVFYGCHLLDAYLDENNTVRVIPRQLLEYIKTRDLSLVNTFQGLHFPKNVSLQGVFNNRNSYNINGIFARCKYLGDASDNGSNNNPVIISGVFNGLRFSNVNEAFLCTTSAQTTGNPWPRTGVEFGPNFIGAKFTSSTYNPTKVYYAYQSTVTKPVDTDPKISNDSMYENYTNAH